ncbi:hypothetical protein [Nitratireductor soli]|uniref:hypothetical protein n=1 Tax=Nitratireductor soli TaxID=1670619 RepID=UPI00069F5716|nr:hypothetical protein [Nitratireductor soli]
MATRPDYTVGTITLTSGSVNFTTSGSALQANNVQPGDMILLPAKGLTLVVAAVTGQNSGTLTNPCPAGAAGAGQPLRIRFQPDGSRYSAAVQALVELLESGNNEALAGLVGAANTMPFFTGLGTMDVKDIGSLPNGSVGAPALNFGMAGAPNTGFYRPLGSAIDLAIGGVQHTRWHSSHGIELMVGSFKGSGAGLTNIPLSAIGESGLWTPTLTGFTTPGTPTYVQQQGSYVRIGAKLVLATVYLVVSNIGGATGQFVMGGIPFSMASGPSRRSLFFPSFWGGLGLGSPYTYWFGFGITTDALRLYKGAPTTATNALSNSDVTGTITIYGTTVYEAA